ncbi:related to Two-component system protein B [Ramularia collo-cygni]|uniref:histidine kinase n=1 Tax=Ramularia collo-cygni TaxID=112498 RepID=A0A2D3UWA1_9PEZI|nr:related to Two-component system protein B [Ramularia collo-cygni]CZT21041.1 related to Two-component system protein B [Ramularia collo-cygni]
MRIPIRIQLGGVILVSSLIGLAVISIAVWVTIHAFVLDLRASRLALTASLKAAQLATNLDIMQTSSGFVSTRILIQNALTRYNTRDNNTAANWVNSIADIQAAIGGDASLGQALLLQIRIWPRDDDGPGSLGGLLNVTAQSVLDNNIPLPYKYENGTSILMGANDTDSGSWGYPPNLYPNLTYFTEPFNATYRNSRAMYQGVVLMPGAALLLGPWRVSPSLDLVSISMPISDNNNLDLVLGYMTVVMDARLIMSVLTSDQGLGDSGSTLLLGPADPSNVFSTANSPFNANDFSVIYSALAKADLRSSDSSGSSIHAINENGDKVSVGYSLLTSPLVDWIVIVEQSRKEVWRPINRLRNVILSCLFATAILMALVSFPLAHVASLPIIRLRQAAARSMEPPGNSRSSLGSSSVDLNRGEVNVVRGIAGSDGEVGKEGAMVYSNPVSKWKQKRQEATQARRDERRKRAFRIPGKVKERKYCVRDELSELTSTFNEMSDELMMQYSRLEERVQQRTAELETSKKAAEAANESKTLFIANISHELKTPLNGILGMTAVCLSEPDPIRLKRSLGIIYKSGDLLLHLLNDLLTFSKNEVGQHLSLDEKEFRLRDIQTQTLAIFEKQAREGDITLKVEFQGADNTLDSERRQYNGPADTGKMQDMILWGDVHRILQIVVNLCSNALKFTPKGGSVVLTVRCLPELPPAASRSTSMNSRQSRNDSSRHRTSDTFTLPARPSLANVTKEKSQVFSVTDRNSSPPPGKFLYFEFEVQDTGPGIQEEMLSKIFLPFVQADLGLSKKYGGTGLGLSICSQLASLMKGSVTVKSTVGVGSIFTLKMPLRLVQSRPESSPGSLTGMRTETSSRSASFENDDRSQAYGVHDALESPLAETPETTKPQQTAGVGTVSQPRLVGLSQPFFAASQPMESPNSQSGAMKHVSTEATRGDNRIRVLVAEDNKINQEIVLRMLRLEDIYDVTVAKDGQEALDLVKESMRGDDHQAFNLIFMDVQMPNVDGLQSTRLIREIGYQAPIVALTAFAEESNIRDCLDSGMNYFLSKPIRRPQLKKVLKEYCQPIPEETEEAASPGEQTSGHGGGTNTTIVMVNKAPEQPSASKGVQVDEKNGPE